jgi:hypothetical protein
MGDEHGAEAQTQQQRGIGSGIGVNHGFLFKKNDEVERKSGWISASLFLCASVSAT